MLYRQSFRIYQTEELLSKQSEKKDYFIDNGKMTIHFERPRRNKGKNSLLSSNVSVCNLGKTMAHELEFTQKNSHRFGKL